MPQRRNYTRYDAEVLLWWLKDWDPIPLNMLDISEGGMLCEFPEKLETGTQVELQFEFPDYEGTISSRCVVAYCRPMGNRSFYIGLKLNELTGIHKDEFSERMMTLPKPGGV
ncbi:MAG: hypothetical protein CSA81_00220 [Acidobacteria bacterium]|nr:MAG: hypothetical protein CSA81_00220 [Acidobacteriota bacterium]PIE91416.1 MAG: hypothetical protein CR997_01100 [Acidobacteriota bacterium]